MTPSLLDPQPAPPAPEAARPGTAAPEVPVAPPPSRAGADLWRRARSPVGALAALLLLALVTVVVRGQVREGRLDPVATDPGGARALAVLLEDRGVDVRRVTTTEAALAGEDDATVLVPFPQALSPAAVTLLAAGEADLVVLGPADEALSRLAPGLRVAGTAGLAVRPPSCSLPAARAAGAVDIGGLAYDTGDASAVACYETTGGALLVQVARPGGGTTTVLGDGEPLTNARLASEGNAALGLLLLGGRDEVRWLMPSAGAESPEEARGLLELLPAGVRAALVLGGVAVVLTAAWRARRLGPVVVEPLPVVVRAAEAVEGRARLYRAARARGRAAESLRAATRARLATRTGGGVDPAPAALVAATAALAGLPEPDADGLLYGPAPEDDRALVRLAADLDGLEARVAAGGPAPIGAAAGPPAAEGAAGAADRRGPA